MEQDVTDTAKNINRLLIDNMSNIADLAVKDSLRKTSASFDIFKNEINEKLVELFDKIPVLQIQINNNDAIKISKEPSAILPRLLLNAELGLYSFLIGPAGCGKTTAANQVAEALGLQFGSVCLTAGASETWLFGRPTPVGFIEGMFSKIYREGGVFLADEMDAADANLLLSINTALSHDEMLNPMNGEVIKKHQNFIFIGAGNTNGKGGNHLYTGRNRLDAATLDRFVIISIDYDQKLEKKLCPEESVYNLLILLRGKLKMENYDEFISTRAFINSYRQYQSGLSIDEIIDSLTSNWGDMAKKMAKTTTDIRFMNNKKKNDSFSAQLTRSVVKNDGLIPRHFSAKMYGEWQAKVNGLKL